jgi:tRNA(Ile)-lysidine synthetase-like protein
MLAELNLSAGDRLLVAVSGGPDSMALAAATKFEASRAGLLVAGCVVDHGMQTGSHDIALEAQQRLLAIGIDPVEIEQVEVKTRGEGLEAAAREVRYKALERARKLTGSSWILTGHSQDDQAETVLLGLARGSGLRSISGMPRIDSERKLARPLLGISRAELRQSCIDQDVEFWDDPHNLDERFLRIKVRNLSQQLEQTLGPGFNQALAKTASSAAQAADLIARLAENLVDAALLRSSAKQASYSVSELAAADLVLLNQALHTICQRAGARNISRVQIEEVASLITNWHGQKPLSLAGITVERVASQLVVKKNPKLTPGAC